MKYSAFPIVTSLINGYLLPGEIKSYLEIGVSDGFTLFNVLSHCPRISDLILCDNWTGNYGGTGRGNHDYIEAKLVRHGFPLDNVTFLDGDSQIKIPEYFEQYPDKKVDLGFVDGDHSENGLLGDLENMIEHAHILVVHDIRNANHLYLLNVFRDFYDTVREKFILIDDGCDMGMLLSRVFLNWNSDADPPNAEGFAL
ncbi:MAG: class I SAM-dependent methyltransferase [Deltaproteobacteria bacterium]|nr:class I SAM-dependent methyltransferase [Deltaproteobacteria bacterium]